jgi:hypothetical protein
MARVGLPMVTGLDRIERQFARDDLVRSRLGAKLR